MTDRLLKMPRLLKPRIAQWMVHMRDHLEDILTPLRLVPTRFAVAYEEDLLLAIWAWHWLYSDGGDARARRGVSTTTTISGARARGRDGRCNNGNLIILIGFA